MSTPVAAMSIEQLQTYENELQGVYLDPGYGCERIEYGDLFRELIRLRRALARQGTVGLTDSGQCKRCGKPFQGPWLPLKGVEELEQVIRFAMDTDKFLAENAALAARAVLAHGIALDREAMAQEFAIIRQGTKMGEAFICSDSDRQAVEQILAAGRGRA